MLIQTPATMASRHGWTTSHAKRDVLSKKLSFRHSREGPLPFHICALIRTAAWYRKPSIIIMLSSSRRPE